MKRRLTMAVFLASAEILSAVASRPAPQPLTLVWDYPPNHPEIVFNVYSSLDRKSWRLEGTVPNKYFPIAPVNTRLSWAVKAFDGNQESDWSNYYVQTPTKPPVEHAPKSVVQPP